MSPVRQGNQTYLNGKATFYYTNFSEVKLFMGFKPSRTNTLTPSPKTKIEKLTLVKKATAIR